MRTCVHTCVCLFVCVCVCVCSVCVVCVAHCVSAQAAARGALQGSSCAFHLAHVCVCLARVCVSEMSSCIHCFNVQFTVVHEFGQGDCERWSQDESDPVGSWTLVISRTLLRWQSQLCLPLKTCPRIRFGERKGCGEGEKGYACRLAHVHGRLAQMCAACRVMDVQDSACMHGCTRYGCQ